MLTTDQLNFLKGHLKSIGIKYEETFNEFLDHYATLTEQHLAEGQPFHEAWRLSLEEMGGGDKLRTLEEQTVTQWREQLNSRHWQIIRHCFRWPAIVATLLVGVLVYLLFSVTRFRYFQILTLVFFMLPATYFLLFQYIPGLIKYWRGKRTRITSLKDNIVGANFSIVVFLYNVSNIIRIFTDNLVHNPLYQAFFLAFGFFAAIYLFSLFQLYQERLKVSR